VESELALETELPSGSPPPPPLCTALRPPAAMVDKPTVGGVGSQSSEETDPSSACVPWVMVASVGTLGTLGTVAGTAACSPWSVSAGLPGGLGELEFCDATPSSAVPSNGTSLNVALVLFPVTLTVWLSNTEIPSWDLYLDTIPIRIPFWARLYTTTRGSESMEA
jgi:hypothetical protein